MLGVPVIDRDPVELRGEIALGLGHQNARECLKVREFGGVVGRDDEAKVVAITVAAFGEGMGVRRIQLRVEQAAGFAAPGRAVAAEIAQMGRQRSRRPHPAHDPRLDHRAARPVAQPVGCGQCRRSAATKATGLAGPRAETARLLRGADSLVQERLYAWTAGADASRPNAKFVVSRHGDFRRKVR